MQSDKQKELVKFRELNLATIDYNRYLYEQAREQYSVQVPDFAQNFDKLKAQVQENYKNGKLGILRKWYYHFTEGFQEAGFDHNVNYTKYIKEKTGYDVDTLNTFYNHLEKIILKGKITTADQYRDVCTMVNQLSQADPLDNKKIDQLNHLLIAYSKK
jgi:hypothetical protein